MGTRDLESFRNSCRILQKQNQGVKASEITTAVCVCVQLHGYVLVGVWDGEGWSWSLSLVFPLG